MFNCCEKLLATRKNDRQLILTLNLIKNAFCSDLTKEIDPPSKIISPSFFIMMISSSFSNDDSNITWSASGDLPWIGCESDSKKSDSGGGCRYDDPLPDGCGDRSDRCRPASQWRHACPYGMQTPQR